MFFFEINNVDTVRKLRAAGTMIAAVAFTFVFFAGVAYHQSFEYFSIQTRGNVVHLSKLVPACGGTICSNPSRDLLRYRYTATLDARFTDQKGVTRQSTLDLTEHTYDEFRHARSVPISYLPFAPQFSFVGEKKGQLLWVLIAAFVALVIAMIMWAAVFYYEYIASDSQIMSGEAAYRRRTASFN